MENNTKGLLSYGTCENLQFSDRRMKREFQRRRRSRRFQEVIHFNGHSSAENKDVALTLLATANTEKCSSLPVRAQKA